MLTAQQIERFHTDGYLLVEDVIPPERYLDPVIHEYEGVLDNLADELHADGEIDSTYADLPFDKRVTRIYAETGRAHAQYFDFSLPFSNVTEQTPFWAGQAVLDALTAEPILDVVESLIGPEIYSNPVQHVRIKPPEQYLPKANGRPVLAATEWHQDHGVVTPDADDTDMLTVWFSLTDTPVEMGCLKVVPRSHRDGLRQHCLNHPIPGARSIPEKLFQVEDTLPIPTRRGDLICVHKQTVHGSLANVSEEVRWSFDLRYNPIGQHTGREAFPGFVARSRKAPHLELRDGDQWRASWEQARSRMATINQGGQTDVPFGRWTEGHPDCA
ncbi:MAG: phytanoyl-CoA dioxygenase family protein [Spirochaetaceae bacterium]|nr:phytanoyl-CoA dioxygenase family protein [Spirochaetaceae bacterium]